MGKSSKDIKVTFDDFSFTFPSKKELDRLARDILDGARAAILRSASSQLTSTLPAYKTALSGVKRKGSVWVLELEGELAMMVEEGFNGGDMRNWLLQGNTKTSKSGNRYKSIPFTHSIGGIGNGVPTTLSPPGEMSLSNRLTLDVGVRKTASKRVQAGMRTLNPSRSLPQGLAPRINSRHTTDPFAGMQVRGQGNQRNYTTFRTISDNPNTADKWQHPGIKPRKIMEKAGQAYIDKMLSKLGF